MTENFDWWGHGSWTAYLSWLSDYYFNLGYLTWNGVWYYNTLTWSSGAWEWTWLPTGADSDFYYSDDYYYYSDDYYYYSDDYYYYSDDATFVMTENFDWWGHGSWTAYLSWLSDYYFNLGYLTWNGVWYYNTLTW